MDYTNFVRTYYRIATQKLKDFVNYNGSIVDTLENLDIPNDKKHTVETQCMFLPSYELNINADISYFEKFMEYYGDLYPQLGCILLNRPKLIELYEQMRVGSSDDAISDAISLYVNAGTDFLKTIGVLS
jgi:hypothetical protein